MLSLGIRRRRIYDRSHYKGRAPGVLFENGSLNQKVRIQVTLILGL